MDLNKLTLGDRVVGVSAILFLIFMFFPWFSYDVGGFEIGDQSGFDFFLFGWIPLLLAIAMVAQIGLTRFSDTRLPAVGSLTWGQVHLILGAIAAVLVILKLLIGDDAGAGPLEVDGDRSIGIFLATIAALGLVAGGALKMRDPADAGAGGVPPPPRA
jgi:hypothetical protein